MFPALQGAGIEAYFLERFFFMGVSQQIMSQVSTQPQTSSMVTANPQTPQEYVSPTLICLAPAFLAGALLATAFFTAIFSPSFFYDFSE
jgi:hypothetical protein